MLNRYNIPIILSIVLLLPFVSADAWLFGTIQKGDIFVYDICDHISIDRNTMSSSNCHTITITVLDRVISSHGDVFLLNTIINNSNSITYDILELDANSLNIYGNTGSNYHAQTLKHTVFWLHETARIKHIDLQISQDVIGEHVSGVITEYKDNIAKIDLQGSLHKGTVHINKNIGLPIYGDIQSANTRTERDLFTFELISQKIRDTEIPFNEPPIDILPPINDLPPGDFTFGIPGEMINGTFYSYESNFFIDNPNEFGIPGEMIDGEFRPFDNTNIQPPFDIPPTDIPPFEPTQNITTQIPPNINLTKYGLGVDIDIKPPTTKEEYDHIINLLFDETDPDRIEYLNQLLFESEYIPEDEPLTLEDCELIIQDIELQLVNATDPNEISSLEDYLGFIKDDCGYIDTPPETINNNNVQLNTVQDYNNRISELERLIPESTPEEQSQLFEDINKLRMERDQLNTPPPPEQDIFGVIISEMQRFFNELLKFGNVFQFMIISI